MLTCNQSLTYLRHQLGRKYVKLCLSWLLKTASFHFYQSPCFKRLRTSECCSEKGKNCYILIDYVSNAQEMWTISWSICVPSSAVSWWDEIFLCALHYLATGHAFAWGRASSSEKGTTRHTYLYFIAFLFFLIVHTIPFIVTYDIP